MKSADANLLRDRIETPIGTLTITWSERGLHSVKSDSTQERSTTGAISKTIYGQAFEEYFSGTLSALEELPVVLEGSVFQIKVWKQLAKIPIGKTLSYKQLASKTGQPKAARAVGNANGKNPLCIVVPCHRVIAADGSLGGYSAGLEIKRWLLRHEGAKFRDN